MGEPNFGGIKNYKQAKTLNTEASQISDEWRRERERLQNL